MHFWGGDEVIFEFRLLGGSPAPAIDVQFDHQVRIHLLRESRRRVNWTWFLRIVTSITQDVKS
jgi:hypothetical protein